MIPKTIIEKAIEGGWVPEVYQGCNPTEIKLTDLYERAVHFVALVDVGKEKPVELKQQACLAEITLDPAFWQALGRSKPLVCAECGNEIEMVPTGQVINTGDGGAVMKRPTCKIHGGNPKETAWWIFNAHRFSRLVLTGGDTEKFWADLLK